MARTRLYPLDDLLDVAEQIVTSADPAGLTLRALAAASGASNGTIYHAFRSKEELLARLWLRCSERLDSVTNEALEATQGGVESGVDAVVAVAQAPVVFADRYPTSAQLFFAQRSEQLYSSDIAPEVRSALEASRRRFVSRLRLLATGMWDRSDAVAVEAITACVVDIPGGLLQRNLTTHGKVEGASGARIDAAVRAVLALPLAPPPTRSNTKAKES